MGLFAGRSAARMGARQQYRTMSRMQRRRSAFQSSTGMHQDFQPRDEEQEPQQTQSAEPATPTIEDQIGELANMKQKGFITEEEFSAKKKQILGI